MTKFEKDKNEGHRFWLGAINATHEIGDIQIIEYTDRETSETGFAAYVYGESCRQSGDSLDYAILLALAYKYDGINSQAARLMAKMLGMNGGG